MLYDQKSRPIVCEGCGKAYYQAGKVDGSRVSGPVAPWYMTGGTVQTFAYWCTSECERRHK